MRVSLFAVALICACAPLQAHSASRRSTCQPDEYNCYYDRCIKISEVCNVLPECWSGLYKEVCEETTSTSPESSSDSLVSSSVAEESAATCGADQFLCPGGPCLPAKFRCNNFADCSDGSDERGCPPPTQPPPSACRGDQFQCWDLACVPEVSRCNGINDCSDLSDEYYCPPMDCRADQFRCSSGQCIAAEARCNDVIDCEDFSDEFNCNKYKSTERTTPTAPMDCRADQFRCSSGQCIAAEARCNDVIDCEDFSDEFNCNKYKSTERTTPREIETTPLVPSTTTAKSVFEVLPGASIFRPPVSVARPPAPTGDRVLVDLPSWLAVDQDAQFSLSLAPMLRQRTPRDKLALQIDILRLFKSKIDQTTK